MIKIIIFKLIFVIMCLNVSCGFKSEEEVEEIDKSFCDGKNNIQLSISNYQYQMKSEDFEFYTDDFDVVKSELFWQNDSVMTFRLKNFEAEKIESDNHIIIEADLRTHNDELLQPGTYKYNAFDQNLWARITIRTNVGTVWFNRGPGMPEQGYIEIDHISDEEVCGSFNLKVNNPDDGLIGTVILKGKFFIN